MKKNNESGRSMVEMLGVLAIVGVLSVGGIAGYTTAMNAHRANEAVNNATRLAMLLSSKRLLNSEATLIDELDGTGFQISDAKDKIVLSVDVPEAVRAKIRNMGLTVATLGTDTQGKLTFTFNNDLSPYDVASTQPIVDSSIDNASDCAEAGKTWCHVEGSNANSGVCSNVTNCCKAVTMSACQACQRVSIAAFYEGDVDSLIVASKQDGTKCDYNGDGNISDGVCSSGECVSNGTTECDAYTEEGMNSLLAQATQALQNADFVTAVAIADQANTISCTTCDESNGINSVSDNTFCPYADVGYFVTSGDFLSGYCHKGKCIAEPESSCLKNSDCNEWCERQSSDTTCYCDMTATETGEEYSCWSSFTGNCVAITETEKAQKYKNNMNWWSANNFCAAMGLNLPSRTTSCDVNSCPEIPGVTSSYYWLHDCHESFCTWSSCSCQNHDNTCRAFLGPTNGDSVGGFNERSAEWYALCE